MTALWYALRSKPNKEDFLAHQLSSHEVEVYYPRLQVLPVNPRSRKVRPYFPGYLFIRVDLDLVNLSELRWMPGASDLVSFDGEPASVPEHLIIQLRKLVDYHNESTRSLVENFEPGEPVVIQDGPFAGYEAIFDTQLAGQDRVRVLLNFLQSRKVPVDLQSRQIRRAKRT